MRAFFPLSHQITHHRGGHLAPARANNDRDSDMGGARALCHRAIARAVVGGVGGAGAGGGTGWFGVTSVVETGLGAQLQQHRAWSRAASSAGAIGGTTRYWEGGALSRMMSPPAATSSDGGRGCFAAEGSKRTAHSAAGDGGANGGGSNHGFATVAKVSSVPTGRYLPLSPSATRIPSDPSPMVYDDGEWEPEV